MSARLEMLEKLIAGGSAKPAMEAPNISRNNLRRIALP